MWAYILRKLLYSIPVYLGIILLMMAALRVQNPIKSQLGKFPTEEQVQQIKQKLGLDKPLFIDIGVWRRPWAARHDNGHLYYTKTSSFDGGYKATWRVPLEPGAYDVYAVWTPLEKGNKRAPFRVLDDVITVADAVVNVGTLKPPIGLENDAEALQGVVDAEAARREAPFSGLNDRVFEKLAGAEFSRGLGQVTLSNLGDGVTIADSVVFVAQGGEGEPIWVTPADDGFETTGRHWTMGRFAHSFIENQYFTFLRKILTFDFTEESWSQKGRPVGDILKRAVPPSLSISVPTLAASASVSIVIALISAYFRGRTVDRTLMTLAVLGMSVSFLVYIIFGQFFGAYLPNQPGWIGTPFAVKGYKPWFPLISKDASLWNWVQFCMLPVLIGMVVAIGYDTRFYRAVMVEESSRDYITTAVAKGASKPKVIFVHMLKNAMIPIITRIMSTLPFLVMGSVLLEMYFVIPGMGFELINAITGNDFPVIQAFVAAFAALFIASLILTDVLYAVVDPRVRLS
jgi:peptide/nickel transport system permease protein